MYIESPHINQNIMDIDFQSTIDPQFCRCKFYNKEIEVKHTYLLLIPGQKDTTTFRINFDQTAEPNEETLKYWTSQPWYHHCIIEKYHMIQPTNRLLESSQNPFERQWTRWLKKGQRITTLQI